VDLPEDRRHLSQHLLCELPPPTGASDGERRGGGVVFVGRRRRRRQLGQPRWRRSAEAAACADVSLALLGVALAVLMLQRGGEAPLERRDGQRRVAGEVGLGAIHGDGDGGRESDPMPLARPAGVCARRGDRGDGRLDGICAGGQRARGSLVRFGCGWPRDCVIWCRYQVV
jgi:hypothetical protein